MTLDEYIFKYMAQLELYWTGQDKHLSMTFHNFCKEEYENGTFLFPSDEEMDKMAEYYKEGH